MMDVNSPAIFQVMIPGNTPPADPLGLWQAVGADATRGRQVPDGVTWRADLPADLGEAAQVLDAQALLHIQSRRALQAVPQRLYRDLYSQPEATAGQAYAVNVAEEAGAQRVLLQARQYTAQGVSFSALDELGVNDVVQFFEGFVSQVRRLVGQFALVESASGGLTLGLTRVGWDGGVYTFWGLGAGVKEAALHNRLLHTALAARQDWLRLLTLSTAAILRVSAALALTPFLPLTIWTAWNYIQEILKEYRHIRNL
jgi:hypothetical protein